MRARISGSMTVLAALSIGAVAIAAGSGTGRRLTSYSPESHLTLTVLDTVPGSETAVSARRVTGERVAILADVLQSDSRVRLYLLDGHALALSRSLTLGEPGDEFSGTIGPLDDDHLLATYLVSASGTVRTVVAKVGFDGALDWQAVMPGTAASMDFDRPPRAAAGPGGLVVVAYRAGNQTRVARLDHDGMLLGETPWPGDDGSGAAPFGLDVTPDAIWLGVQNGLGLVSRYGVVKLDTQGQIVWARSQTQDVINILGPAWIRAQDDGTAVVVAGEEGPFGSHRATLTRYDAEGAVLNRSMDPPAEVNGGGILLSASIQPDGYVAYSVIVNSDPYLKLVRSDGAVTWAVDLTARLGASGSALPSTVDLDPLTRRIAVSHDSLGFSVFYRTGEMIWNESFATSGAPLHSFWGPRGEVLTVVNAFQGGSQDIHLFSRAFRSGRAPRPRVALDR